MVAGGSSDQVACVHPHKPQLAEIGFFQQFQNSVDGFLSCHVAALRFGFMFKNIIQPFDVNHNNF